MVERLMRAAEIPAGVAVPILLWLLAAAAVVRAARIPAGDNRPARRLSWAVIFLALGLTAHVGLAVWARVAGGSTVLARLGSLRLTPGLGRALAGGTWTFSLLFIFFADRRRFGKSTGPAGLVVLALAALHLGLLVHPANRWSAASPPAAWAIYRNIPFLLLGLLIALIVLRDARAAADRPYRVLGFSSLLAILCFAAAVFLPRLDFAGPFMLVLGALQIVVSAAACRGISPVAEASPPVGCPNLIGKDAKVRGVMRAKDLVQVDGTFEGDLAAGDLVVGKKGRVEGTVTARNITISGQVQGEVEARGLLELIYTASLKGKVRLAGLVVEEGAFLAAECTRIDPPREAGREEAAAAAENPPD